MSKCRVWAPSRNEYVEWDGREVTVGECLAPGPVKPRLVGPAVEKFRRTMGVCRGLNDTCSNIEGHTGECKP